MAETTAFLADLQATAALLNGRPVDGPCDADCGCSTAPTATSQSTASPVTFVPRRLTDEAPPIACSLGAGDMQARIADWQAVLALVEARVPLASGVRLEFGEAQPLWERARLAAAEFGCCPFFGFAVTIDSRGLALEVTAPPDGQDLLAGVFGVAG
jgi:hypothetical protein